MSKKSLIELHEEIKNFPVKLGEIYRYFYNNDLYFIQSISVGVGKDSEKYFVNYFRFITEDTVNKEDIPYIVFSRELSNFLEIIETEDKKLVRRFEKEN